MSSRRWVRTLAARILVAVLGIVTLTVVIGAVLFGTLASHDNDALATARARSVAASVGAAPGVAEQVLARDPDHVLASTAERIRRTSDAAYVVIIGADGTRYSHPNPDLIGKRIEEPVVALDGRTHTGIDNGSLGRSANVRAPVIDAAGRPVGEVSVGILTTEVASRFRSTALTIAAYALAALVLSSAASLLLARAIKRITFGLEPAEIVGLVQEREATLHGIREGVVAVADDGRISLVNDEARRITGLSTLRPGARVEEAMPAGRLRDVLDGTVTGPDLTVVSDGQIVVVNRMPVTVAGRSAGSVVTIRDRTELEGLIGQLRELESLTSALRAQQHEYSNRLHAIAVLLELGEMDDALSFVDRIRTEGSLASDVRSQLGSPALAALLIAKMTIAEERGVRVELSPDSWLPRDATDDYDVVTIVGNLVDNALDAVAQGSPSSSRDVDAEVHVDIRAVDGQMRIAVSDNGPGVAGGDRSRIFEDGFTTKPGPQSRGRRGVGLALVRRIVLRHGGTIEVSSSGRGDGALFEVVLPLHARVDA